MPHWLMQQHITVLSPIIARWPGLSDVACALLLGLVDGLWQHVIAANETSQSRER